VSTSEDRVWGAEIALLGALREENRLTNRTPVELGVDIDELRRTLLRTIGP
jgi:hypothetical protein